MKTLLPFAAFILLIQGIGECLRCVICIKTREWPMRLHDVEELDVVLQHQQELEAAAGKIAEASGVGDKPR